VEPDDLSLDRAIGAALKEYRRIAAHAGAEFDILAEKPEQAAFDNVVKIENQGDKTTVRIQGVFDPFFGFDVRDLINKLDDSDPKNIHVLIESPGGSLRDGLAIYNDLRARVSNGAEVTTEARGLVASAAVLPFLAGDSRTMTEGTQLMVHEAHVGAILFGRASDIESAAKRLTSALKSSNKTMTDVYIGRTGLARNKVTEFLSEETWFTASEALDNKFATEIVDRSASDEPDAETLAAARQILNLNALRRSA